jgi:hypothetical protein
LRLRDRRAKNLAQALDFTRRRAAIDLPSFIAPPATACAGSAGWTELAVSREGVIRASVEAEGTPGAHYGGRLLAGGKELAVVAEKPFGDGDKAVLELSIGKAGVAMIAAASNRLPGLLETTVRGRNGSVCRSTSPALLRLGPL